MKSNHFPTADGISYLEAKNLLLLNYCQSLVYYLLRKAKGFSIEGHPVVRSLVETRLFLEKVGDLFLFSLSINNLCCSYYIILVFLFMPDSTDRQKAPVPSPEANKGCHRYSRSFRSEGKVGCSSEGRGSFEISSEP